MSRASLLGSISWLLTSPIFTQAMFDPAPLRLKWSAKSNGFKNQSIKVKPWFSASYLQASMWHVGVLCCNSVARLGEIILWPQLRQLSSNQRGSSSKPISLCLQKMNASQLNFPNKWSKETMPSRTYNQNVCRSHNTSATYIHQWCSFGGLVRSKLRYQNVPIYGWQGKMWCYLQANHRREVGSRLA